MKKRNNVTSTKLALAVLAALGYSGAASALCPWNTSYDSGLNFCTDANNAFGPFTRAMTTTCTTNGNGSACTGTVNVYYNGTSTTGTAVPVQRWSKTLAQSIRGTADCPLGSIRSANYDNRCVESTSQFGTEVYGEFAQSWIDACRAAPISGGNACYLNRWAASIYTSVRTKLTPAGPNWALPIPNGFPSSDWCVCRNIGTSPHIGWDLVSNASTMQSVAAESGKITSGPTLNGGCGWELGLTDRFGTVWYYRHLNKPNLVNGQSVAAGAVMGIHRDYPSSSCGSGAHLHLERLSGGYFNDSSVSKNCTGTLKSCNYDPRKPWPSVRTSTATDPLKLLQNDAETPAKTPSEDDVAVNRSCRIDPKTYATVDLNLAAATLALPSDLAVSFKTFPTPEALSFQSNRYALSAHFVGNPNNQCSANDNCIVAWELDAQITDGSFKRIFIDNTLRNTAAEMGVESAFCTPADATGAVRVILQDKLGNKYHAEL